ncbi:phage protease [Nonomuraea sp. SYSU D8015]|uniref:phage protease n=1 Tax=Nonomuraea sp. SYSU D8015 TaxID=2593644 RepID=UPI001661584B|nr:phage protease [Nonomuraea sp. SYSU D8015]
MADLVVPQAPPLASLPGVELVQAGQWDLSTGRVTFSRDDLASAVAAVDCPAVRRPVLKLGHAEPDPDEHGMRWDGEPAVGWIDNMMLADSGNTVVGDYVGMPGWLRDILPSAYPDRSIEAVFDHKCQLGHTHPFVITAVSLLGVVPPGVGTLRSLQDVAALYGVTAASTTAADDVPGRVTVTVHASKGAASMPNPRPAEVAAGISSEDVRRAYYEKAPWQEWICEMQLSPLQLIVVDDTTGKYHRVPVQVDGEDEFSFGDKVEVKIRYEDVPADVTAAAATQTIVYASRAESRPDPAQQTRAASVSDTAWSDFSQADYDVDQWHRACLIHTHDGDPDAKSACKLPVREPDGTLNRNAVHAAAARIGQLKGVTADQKQAAARKLASLYRNELDEDPPDSLLDLAGETANASAPQAEASLSPPVEPAAGPTPPTEGATMALDEGLRERLGLEAEAGDEAILAAIDDLLDKATAPPPEPTPQPEPVAAAAALPPGTVAIDEATLADLREKAEQGVAARARQLTEDRDRTIDDAIRAGKTPPARREHWQKAWAADPEGTRELLASLAPGLVPLEDVGEPGGEPTDQADDGSQYDGIFSRKAV